MNTKNTLAGKRIAMRIQKNDADKRVDSVCKKLLPRVPFSALMKEFRRKNIRLNGARTDVKTTVREGDTIEFAPHLSAMLTRGVFTHEKSNPPPAEKPTSVSSRSMPLQHWGLETLYEQDGIVIVNKPPGVSLFPAARKGTVTRALAECYAEHVSLSFTPSVCHRLDTGTGGVLICAYTAAAARLTHKLHDENALIKLYAAVLVAPLRNPDDTDGVTKLTSYLTRDKNKNITHAYNHESCRRPNNEVSLGTAVTYARKIARFTHNKKPLHLYAFAITGGKTHQIRAQVAAFEAPLYQDYKYGGDEHHPRIPHKRRDTSVEKSSRFFLHAAAVIPSPLTREKHNESEAQNTIVFPSAVIAPLPQLWHYELSSREVTACFNDFERRLKNMPLHDETLPEPRNILKKL